MTVNADQINDSLTTFTGAIGLAVPDICSYGLTIGETYVPFDPDPDDDCDPDSIECSQVWVRVIGAGVVAERDPMDGGVDCAARTRLDLEVGVLRCLEIPEKGKAPTATDVLAASMQAMLDMAAIYEAAVSTEVWHSIVVGEWSPEGPLGGQYGGTWTFTVEI